MSAPISPANTTSSCRSNPFRACRKTRQARVFCPPDGADGRSMVSLPCAKGGGSAKPRRRDCKVGFCEQSLSQHFVLTAPFTQGSLWLVPPNHRSRESVRHGTSGGRPLRGVWKSHLVPSFEAVGAGVPDGPERTDSWGGVFCGGKFRFRCRARRPGAPCRTDLTERSFGDGCFRP